MNTKSRIASILQAHSIEESTTGVPPFYLSQINLPVDSDFPLPNNIRLGHLVERIVAGLIKSSSNYKVLFENVQLLKDKTTIGELDFLIEEIETQQVTHLELAYKFYLFDPNISSKPINNWIGPNRTDSLVEKLGKLKSKQFPLLYTHAAQTQLQDIKIEEVSQALCLLVSLFVPYQYQGNFDSNYEKAIKGYYLNFETFGSLDHSGKTYFVPTKKEWGTDPSENQDWIAFQKVKPFVQTSINENQAPMIWCKHQESFEVFFVTWW